MIWTFTWEENPFLMISLPKLSLRNVGFDDSAGGSKLIDGRFRLAYREVGV